jgi:tartrate dehydratase alpha subunit/fumarate hydratase class I-like protein
MNLVGRFTARTGRGGCPPIGVGVVIHRDEAGGTPAAHHQRLQAALAPDF